MDVSGGACEIPVALLIGQPAAENKNRRSSSDFGPFRPVARGESGLLRCVVTAELPVDGRFWGRFMVESCLSGRTRRRELVDA